jgi:hypothetical protein
LARVTRTFFFARFPLAALCLLLPPASAHAGDPIYSFNHQPLAQIFGLPAIGPARVLASGQSATGYALNLATHFVNESNAVEQLTLDGETHRLTVIHRRGVGRGLEWGIEAPLVSQTGGFMDGLIINWHDVFGLPQGGRDQTVRDRLLYRYRRQGVDLLNVTDPSAGVGDLRFTGGYALTTGADAAPLALRAQLKLPSGESETLLGSGAPDLALWLSAGCAEASAGVGRLCGYGGGGVMVLGLGDVIPGLQQRWIGFASGGVAWRFLPAFTALLQLDAHSPFYRDTQLDALGEPAVQLVMGLRWRAGECLSVEAGFTEDVALATTPDISFLLHLRARC